MLDINEMSSMGRIAYIDALRGFTMFLVVYWHVMALSFGINVDESVVGAFFLTFRMPMFFFISGYLGYKAIAFFDWTNFKKLVSKKAFVQLIPTAIFFTLFHISINSSPFVFFREGLTGYWFTLVLFELFISYYTVNYLLKLGGGKIEHLLLVLAVLAVVGNVGALWINTRHPIPRISLVLTLNNFCYYFQFFALGIIAKAIPSLSQRIRNCYPFSIVLFILLFIIQYKWITHDYNRYLYYLIDSIFINYVGLIMILGLFMRSEEYFAQNGCISKIMQFVGKRTLDIYLLHYFFLPTLTSYRYIFFPKGKESYISELIIISVIAAVIMAICLLTSTCLRKSPVLAKYLFGIIPKRNYYANELRSN